MVWTWWRHQMETFSALLAICAGNSPVPGEFPAQRPVTRSFVVFFDVHLNKRLSKQSWGWWFETLSHPLWRHCNDRICTEAIHTGVSHSLTRTGWEAQQKTTHLEPHSRECKIQAGVAYKYNAIQGTLPEKKMQPVCVMSFRVTLQALGQSYNCLIISEANLKNMGKLFTWVHW